jgi:hypothetical protein
MKFKESSVTTQKEILKRKLGGELFTPVTLDASAFADGVCKAGNPISSEGKKVNGGSGDSAAVGICCFMTCMILILTELSSRLLLV